jgi:hypothetical protein
MAIGRHTDHNEYVRKMKSLAKATELDQKEKKGYIIPKEKKCANCENTLICKIFKNRIISEGVYFFGGDTVENVCKKWKQRKSIEISAQNIKNLMKQFKRLK